MERTSEWLWGWDPTPGIVSVWAEPSGRAWVWRRCGAERALVREEARYRPWLMLASLADLQHLGLDLRPESSGEANARITYRELDGSGELRFLVSAESAGVLSSAILAGASRRLSRSLRSLRELPEDELLWLLPEEQYLIASGRTHFRDLGYDDLRRLAFDLETTGLDPANDRIFLVAVRDPEGRTSLLEAPSAAHEAELIRQLQRSIAAADPDIIENHNLHGFDLPFLVQRARRLGVPLNLGRMPGSFTRASARGSSAEGERNGTGSERRRTRFSVIGRELLDSMDAVLRYDFAARSLPGHGLKAVARHFGLSSPEREQIPGARVHDVYLEDPERVRRYAAADVNEAAALARVLGGAGFALARMAPRRYERVADAGAATGVLDPMLIRAYLRSDAALPARVGEAGPPHQGAALYLFATGVARRIVKADVASLYPSLMRAYRIGPERDRLGALLALVEQLLDLRLEAKARARAAAPGSPGQHLDEALSAAMKIVINSAYGYLGAVGLTRFADVHAANEVTRRGREVLDRICTELAARGVTLLEADTDGVYFSVPESWDEAAERRAVAEVAALLPEGVQLEFDGRYAAMLSHEPKNYALSSYQGALLLRGVAFRSRRAEPFGEAFLRRAIKRLLAGDVPGVRAAYVECIADLRSRRMSSFEVSAEVRLTKTPAQYAAAREQRRELVYESMLGSGRTTWRSGERVRVYRMQGGRGTLLSLANDEDPGSSGAAPGDPRDYDVEYYVRLLRETFAARLARALEPEVFAEVFADPQQLALFTRPLEQTRPILTLLHAPLLGTPSAPPGRV
ncbi:MAG TPA: DNA polymerase domain-containing protein, partial [Polyangiaceae bacterium]|nr:DNA polymerase domain-containing protein [Polyangiaceae bacterium]